MIVNNVYESTGGGETILRNPPYINTRADIIEVSNSTAITSSIYAEAGEIVLASFLYRDENTVAVPDGWERIFESEDWLDPVTRHAKLAFYKFFCQTSGNISVTFNITSNNISYLSLVTVKGATDIVYDSTYNIYHKAGTDETAPVPFVPIPQKSSETDYVIYGAGTIFWKATSPYETWEFGENKLFCTCMDERSKSSKLGIIDNILGNDEYEIAPCPDATGVSFMLFGLKLITSDTRYATINLTFNEAGEKALSFDGTGTVDLHYNGTSVTIAIPCQNYSVVLNNTTMSITTTGNMTGFSVINSDLTDMYTNCRSIEVLELYDNQLSSLTLDNISRLRKLVIHGNNSFVTNATKLTALCASLPNRNNMKFGSITIGGLDALNMRSIEPSFLAKRWVFGSALPYNETERAKIDNKLIQACIPDIWESAEYGAGMVACMADTALYPDLLGFDYDTQLRGGWNVVDNNDDFYITESEKSVTGTYHGSAVTGIICGNGTLMYGICPHASIYFVRINLEDTVTSNWGYYSSAMEKAVEWDTTDRIDVFSLSFDSLTTASSICSQQVLNCVNAGIKPFMAGGNRASTTKVYPQANTNVIAVAAAISKTEIASYSNHYEGINYAELTDVLTEKTPNSIANFSGTSCATPFLAGTYMLIKKILWKINGEEPSIDDVVAEMDRYSFVISNYSTNYQGNGLVVVQNTEV